MRNRGMDLDAIIAGMEPPKAPPREKRHSPVYEALWVHRVQLAPHLDFPRQPDWPEIAAQLAARGLTNSLGAAPTPEVVRKTWWKVGRDQERLAQGVRRTRRSPAAKESADAAPPPASKPDRAALPVAPPADEGDDGFRFAGGPKRWKDSERK